MQMRFTGLHGSILVLMGSFVATLALSAALTVAAAAPATAASLRAGDVVVVGWRAYEYVWTVWRLDPQTLDTTRIATAGLLSYPGQVAVRGNGDIVVADRLAGLISIDPASGAQSVLVSPAALGGREAEGVCNAPDGGLYVTGGGSSGAVLHVDPVSASVSLVTSGGRLVRPTCVAVGPDGALYVGEFANPPRVASDPYGSIVRVTASGEQSLLAGPDGLSRVFFGPQSIALTPDGYLWSSQAGQVGSREGYLVRTRVSDGASEVMGPPPYRSFGLVALPNGNLLATDCSLNGPDCYYWYVFEYPGGPRLAIRAASMAVVPAAPTPVRRSSWGEIKSRYR